MLVFSITVEQEYISMHKESSQALKPDVEAKSFIIVYE